MFVGVGASRVRDLFEQAKENAAGHRLHRRDRRRRPPPRRRHGRRPRRARADPQPAARRDGRLRRPRRGHPHRGHQPSRRARPRAAAPGPLRPPDPGRRPRPQRPPPDPQGPLARQADRAGHRPAEHRPPHARLHRCRPGQRAQRGRAAHRAQQREDDHQRRPRRGDRPRHRRPAASYAPDERAREAHHRLPRGRPRPGRRGAARHRPGAQGDDPAARSGAGLHDGAARPRQVLPDPQRDARQPRLHARRHGRGGADLPRRHLRRRQRHREGDRPGPRDGHPVRHDRAPRRGQARRQQLRALPGPRHGPPAQLLRGDRRRGRRGDQDAAGPRPPGGLRDPRARTATSSTRSCSPCSTRRPSTRREIAEIFEALDIEPGPAGLDRLARARAVDDPAGRHPAGDPRPRPAPTAAAQEPQTGGAILTPPGAGGDVHGGPGVRPDTPTPPDPGRAMTDPVSCRSARRRTSPSSTTPGPRRPSASC